MTSQLNLIIDDFTRGIGDRQFFTVEDLQSLGFFGTKYAARRALKNGQLSYIQISARRRVIPRAILLAYLKHNTSEALEFKK